MMVELRMLQTNGLLSAVSTRTIVSGEVDMNIPLHLLEGYRRFKARLRDRPVGREWIGRDGKPRAMVISCADSCVHPETIFGAWPGELYAVSNIAALVPPYEEGVRLHSL
jgi:carbonic anhydrase